MKKSWFLPLFFLLTLCIKSVYSQSPILSDYIEFDGSTGYVEIPGDTSNDFGANDAFTFEAWIKISSGPSNNGDKSHIFGRTWSEFYLLNDNGNIKLQGRYRVEYDGNWPIVTSSSSLSLDTWYHVAYSYSKVNGNLSIHINGQLDGNTSSSSFITGGGNSIGLGARIDNYGTSVSGFFNGSIDEARIWNVQRTAEEINSNKSSTQSQNSNLVLYYKLDDGLGSSVIDSSGNNLTGIASGTYQWSRPTVTLTDTDSDNLVSNSDVVTITATFSESMASTPTISLSGILSDVLMSSTASTSIWTYTWTVSTTVTSTTATVSGTDLAGNTYNGTESITFKIDNTLPTLLYFVDLSNESQMFSFGMDSGTSTGGDNAWQQFKPSSSGHITRIVLKQRNPTNSGSGLNGDGSPSVDFPIEMKIYSGVSSNNGSTLSGGTVIGTTVAYISKDQNFNGPISYTFNNPTAVVSGTTYYFQITEYDRSIYAPFAYTNFNYGNDVYPSNSANIGGYSNDLSFEIHTKPTLNAPIKNGDSFKIIVGFSEALSVTPTLSLSGGVLTNVLLEQSLPSNEWSYTWTVSGSLVTSTTATVSGTDLSGNAYAGTDSITFTIDNTDPTVTLTDTDSDDIISDSDVVIITATFSESMAATPTLSLSGITSNVFMSATASDSVWTYTWTVSGTTVTSTTATVSATDLSGNAYSGTESITFIIDNTDPTVTLTDTDSDNIVSNSDVVTITVVFDELVSDPSLMLYNVSSSLLSSNTLTVSDSLIFSNYWRKKSDGSYENPENDGGNENYAYMGYIQNTSHYQNGLITFVDYRSGQDALHYIIETSSSLSSIQSHTYIGTFQDSNYFTSNVKTSNIEQTISELNGLGYRLLTIETNSEYNYFKTLYSSSQILNDNNPYWIGLIQNTSSSNYSEPSGGWEWVKLEAKQWEYSLTISTTLTSITAKVSATDLAGNAYAGTDSITFAIDNTAPTVTLTDTDSDNIVSNTDVVTITATFSESMAATPTISLSGVVSDVSMSATASDSIWTYTWTVSGTSVISTTAIVSGTDLAGNAYAGTESITFTIDNTAPTIINTDSSVDDDYFKGGATVQLSVTFSEAVITPTITIGSDVSNASMTVSASTNSTTWYYDWAVPTGVDGTYVATVSTTDLIGNAYSGTDSVTLTVDNTDPEISSVSINDDNDTITLTFTEPTFIADATSNSYTTTDTTYYLSVNQSGGTATITVDQIRYDSTTDDRVYYLDITVNGTSDGSEQISIAPFSASRFKDRVGNFAATTQSSNTLYLTNNPPKFTSTSVNSNNTSITIVFSEGVTADTSGTELSKTDFTLAVSGGAAVLASATPIALSKTDSKTYVLTTSYSVPSNGSEILTVTPISSAVFDSKGTQINLSSAQSNTVQLNDQAGPFITGATLDSQNRYVDFTFSEGVYATASPTSAVTSSSFTLSQSSGPSYGMTISSITTAGGGVLSGGETTLRFNLESAVKPTGQEVFAITATDSSSVVDASGNSMTVSQTNNTFQLKPPTSGGVSPKKSTISAAPAQMIGNGINTAVITVQAKDSLGQNFLEGGYQITLFGPNGDLTTTDNQNGTYSASYTPEAITQDFQELTFGFRVADTNGTPTALLQLYLDEDGDGVYNINDACLGTEAGLEIDATGCALNQLDSDNDGVFDDLDECPDTPEQELNNVQGTPTYGELIPTVVDEKGCGASQRDTDSDGIVDTEDNCIETANADQADTDGDGIGDVCDTDNPLPEITTTEIKFVQLPQNGTTVGKIEATDPDGETLTFTQSGDNFTGVLSIASDGSITVSSGALLTFDSTYNGASLGFTVSDGKNDVPGSVKILIEDVPRPPEISIITLEISEDAEVGTIVGFVEAKDPMGGQIVSISLQGDGFIELKDGVLKTTQELDYEENTIHPFTITAQASDRSDGPGLTGSKSESLRVSDIPNATYTGRFFISIFNVVDETLGAKVDHRRYFNPYNKNVGKWKVKKRVAGGADADKFTVKTRSKTEQKNGDPIEDENEDYLDFITPPDYENPGDANGDNIYEVEVEYINTTDGAPEVPIVVTQTNIQVPEGSTTTIELQSQPVLPTDDNDGDGVPDIIDNSPLVANADQTDEDGDGVGDVSDDFDHDGVWNPFDTCPDTSLGEIVDSNGCLIYYIPSSNFSISKTEKCAGTNSINIEVVDTSITYNVSVSGAATLSDSFSSSSWSLDNLSAGVYSICITVEGVSSAEFERCFEVTISEPDPLIVNSMFNKNDQTITFGLNGGVSYDITHNGITTQTTKSSYTVSLAKGLNRISISTGIECQGLFENTYLNSYEVKYAPNPFSSELTFTIGGEDRVFGLEVYTPSGQLIDQKVITLPFGIRYYTLQTDNYKQGGYFIRVKGSTIDQSFQVIKE
ncbi:thrombospondin type 3 repeat-containing protein [Flavobacteriaceae bacterium]|nr:thrombospondin type 3 repeat-containing protein [Flavobacteriaceae bacterium]